MKCERSSFLGFVLHLAPAVNAPVTQVECGLDEESHWELVKEPPDTSRGFSAHLKLKEAQTRFHQHRDEESEDPEDVTACLPPSGAGLDQ